ncbi:copper resistance CopC family protein [uncultured Corynebacterium sp.]|uniref:copper resistance CopC family protein n=1 Tax=uncultured Corynebacterium sp. TaxID=159447 RepID=UPI0025E5BC4A|nr:copper resistance CopC family protein [uncultured Corynebacterium sp.]
MKNTRIGRTAAAAMLAGTLALAPAIGGAPHAPVAHAHDSVVSSVPADGARLSEFPERIEMTFSGIPRDSFNTVALSDADTSEVLFTGEPELDGQVISIDVPDSVDPGPGDYVVGFQITSSDGHSTRGKLSFSVDAGSDDAETGADADGDAGAGDRSEAGSNADGDTDTDTDDAATADDAQDGTPTWVWIAGGGLLAVIVAVVAGVAVINRKAD